MFSIWCSIPQIFCSAKLSTLTSIHHYSILPAILYISILPADNVIVQKTSSLLSYQESLQPPVYYPTKKWLHWNHLSWMKQQTCVSVSDEETKETTAEALSESTVSLIDDKSSRLSSYEESPPTQTWEKSRTRAHCPRKFLWTVEISIMTQLLLFQSAPEMDIWLRFSDFCGNIKLSICGNFKYLKLRLWKELNLSHDHPTTSMLSYTEVTISEPNTVDYEAIKETSKQHETSTTTSLLAELKHQLRTLSQGYY